MGFLNLGGTFRRRKKEKNSLSVQDSSLYERLLNWLETGITIREIYVDATQIPGAPELTNVKVVGLSSKFVVFSEIADETNGTFTIRVNDIIGWEM